MISFDPSSNVDVTDEDESKEIIVYETLSENLSKDVSKSECNIVHETLLQKNSADVQTRKWKTMSIKDLQWLEKEQVILTHSSALEIYWINLTLRINGRSWHHQYKRDNICHNQHERYTMIKWRLFMLIVHKTLSQNNSADVPAKVITELKDDEHK